MKRSRFWLLLVVAPLLFAAADVDAAHQVTPESLAKSLQGAKPDMLILNVGPRSLYAQAHLPGAEYISSGASEEGRTQLRERVRDLPKDSAIVLYCGCCPWKNCPNVRPALHELQQMGFTNVKVLYIAHNFGADWVDKKFPVEQGESQ